MSQFALPFEWPADETDSDFILSPANMLAVRHLEHWSLWPVPATILTGPRKSGRSLLGRLFVNKTGGRLIDDADRASEEEIFHAWNHAQASRRPLLLIADARPPAWQVRLPDLASRIAATSGVAIADPDDALIAALVEKGLGARGIALSPDLARWLLPRIERSYVAVTRFVDAMDQAMLAGRRRPSLSLAREVLAAMGRDVGEEGACDSRLR